MKEARAKILTLSQLAEESARARKAGKKVVHCHGVFDLLHIGHIRHFEAAKKLGDVLLVTVTPDRHVNKGPHRPVFNEGLRAEAVAAVGCVDYVAINDSATAIEPIKALRPSLYVKGSDYKDAAKDVTGGIAKEEAAVKAAGGKLAFTEDITFSSSHLLNRHLPTFSSEVGGFLESFTRRYQPADVLRYLEGARKLKVLTVGETIIDEYRYCEAIGKSSKEPTLVVKKLDWEPFAGGILAVANHVAGFAEKVGVVSMLGQAKPQLEFIRSKLKPNVKTTFLYRPGAPTIVKARYVESYHFTKLLEIYEIDDSRLGDKEEEAFCAALARELPKYDVVLVFDYGHGLLTERAVKLLRQKSKFLAVNTQSNAGNIGFHTIGRYKDADLVCLTENELRMEARDRRGDLERLVAGLYKSLGPKRMLVTQGKRGCLGYDGSFARVPAVAGAVQDRVGAGDAFLSLAGLCAAQGAPLEVAGFVGNAAGAQAVATVGHRSSVERVALTKHIEALMK